MISTTVKVARRVGVVLGALIALGTVSYAVFIDPIVEVATEAKKIAADGAERLAKHIETEMALIYRMSGQLDALAVHFNLAVPKPPIVVPYPVFLREGP